MVRFIRIEELYFVENLFRCVLFCYMCDDYVQNLNLKNELSDDIFRGRVIQFDSV
jgi:hypothetical protein